MNFCGTSIVFSLLENPITFPSYSSASIIAVSQEPLSPLDIGMCTGLTLMFLKPLSIQLELEPLIILLVLLQAFGNFCVEFLNKKNVYEFRAGWNMILSMVMVLVPLVLAVVLILQMPYETRYVGRVILRSSV